MRIKSIKITNNKVLGDLELDFTDDKGHILDTIIFAGENGSGKSKLLEIIYNFSSFQQPSIDTTEKQEFVARFDESEIDILNHQHNFAEILTQGLKNDEIKFSYDSSLGSAWSQIKASWQATNGLIYESHGGNFTTREILKIFRCIFSDVEINFNPGGVSTVTSKEIDQEWQRGIRSTSELAREITQLLIDIQTQDDIEFAHWGRKNIGSTIDPAQLDLRMRRFKSAFNFMFPSKKLTRLINEANAKKIIFEEHGKEIPIDSLSSGEKQIVFRGSFLLKDQTKNSGALVLIDEPEISLHPAWQLKIMQFYKKLLTNKEGKQTSQIFVATHSPFIIHNLSRENDKVIVLKRNSHGSITATDKGTFFGWTPESAIQNAFSIEFGTSDKPIVFTEGEYDVQYILKAAELLDKRDVVNGFILRGGGGKGRLNKVWTQAESPLSGIVHQSIMLLYDCDTNQANADEGKVHKRLIPFISKNPVKTGIENLIPRETIEKARNHKSAFFDFTPQIVRIVRGEDTVDPEKIEVNKAEKGNLCNWLCENGTREDFQHFQIIFDLIESILDKVKK